MKTPVPPIYTVTEFIAETESDQPPPSNFFLMFVECGDGKTKCCECRWIFPKAGLFSLLNSHELQILRSFLNLNVTFSYYNNDEVEESVEVPRIKHEGVHYPDG